MGMFLFMEPNHDIEMFYHRHDPFARKLREIFSDRQIRTKRLIIVPVEQINMFAYQATADTLSAKLSEVGHLGDFPRPGFDPNKFVIDEVLFEE